jgi:hypothetical protein
MYVLNIGLGIKKSNKKNSYIKTLYFIMKLIPPLFKKIKIYRSPDSRVEDTVVIYYLNSILPAIIKRLCFNLNQDCIAIYNIKKSAGLLIGRNPYEWGEFNLLKFIQ